MAHQYGKTVIVVTHNNAIAQAADRLIKLKDGRVESIEDNPEPMSIEKVVL